MTPMPGFAGTNGMNTFATRWGSSNACFETATLCFDYIRSCINLIDSYGSTNGPGGTDATNPAQRYAYSYTPPPRTSSPLPIPRVSSPTMPMPTIPPARFCLRGQGRSFPSSSPPTG